MEETNSRSIGKGYGFYMPIAFGLLGLLILGYILVVLFYWDGWKAILDSSVWWVDVLPPLAAGFWIFIFACILKGADDKRTKMRSTAIHQVCKRINREYLAKSDVSVACGEYSAWIEINYDPRKSKLNFNEINFNFK